jgi:methyl-accepting chemotaxis protein WspA
MNSLANLNIGRRLALGFGTAILLFLGVGAMSVYSLARLAEADQWNVHTYRVMAAGDEMLKGMVTMQNAARGYLIGGDEVVLTPWVTGQDTYNKAWAEARGLTVDNPQQQQRLDEIRAGQEAYKLVADRLIQGRREVNAGRKTQQALSEDFRQSQGEQMMQSFRRLLGEFDAAEHALMIQRSAATEHIRAMSRETVIYGSLVALLLATVLGAQITRSITRPINEEIVTTLDRLAKGELSARVNLNRTDELGTISRSLNLMADGLEQMTERERHAREKEAADSLALRQQVDQLVSVTERAANGNLVATPLTMGDDATQRMGEGVQHMVGGLRTLVVNLQGSMVQIRSSINQLSASVRETESTVTEQAATATQVAASTTEITQTARDLAATMTVISRSNEAAVGVADEGQHSLHRLDDTLSKIVDASGAIASRLAVVGEKASTISSVTSTITKVADQTNLLSLNAAIEAEKAGEYGQGFSVIATEIRRLADQTSVAAGDIEQIIKEMQGAVSASVMSMDKFNDEVQRNVGDVRTLSVVLNQVIDHVKASAPQFETVTQGMLAQSEGATQINQAIRQFTESIKLNTQTVRNTEQATHQLSAVADQLQTGISRFRID